MNSSSTFCTAATHAGGTCCPSFGGRGIGVPGADDEADAVFMAVDGEFVAQRQQPALIADFAKLHFARRTPAERAADIGIESDRQPRHSIDVEQRIARIDEAAPQFLVGFLKPAARGDSSGVVAAV